MCDLGQAQIQNFPLSQNMRLSNTIVEYFSCTVERYHSSVNAVRDPDLNAAAMLVGPQRQRFLWKHLLWDAEHGAWNQVCCSSADLAAQGRTSLPKDNNESEQKGIPGVNERNLRWSRYAGSSREARSGRRALGVAALLTSVWPSVAIVRRVCRFLACSPR